MPAPDRIKQLVITFEKNINDYRFNKNETELRRQFLDPFFEALGWDVDNKQGKDERHKEVAHEFSVEIDGQQKKADYAFRTEKDIFDFLVEAKKPSVKVESNPDAAFQIRSYGWSAKLPINILTDFEHFAIYDCRIRPNYAKDDAKTGRIAIFDYKEYITRWDEIANLFSPDAIRNGALDEYTDGLKTKKGTQEVDDAFLEEIEGWREALAKNIASRNKDKNLNEVQINFAVQMTIDRIIFLRIAEERGMEKDRKLFELIDNTNIYKDLLRFFAQADERYNSGLFHFKKDKERENPDTLSAQISIDDKVLKDIIKDLYYPSPYAFTYIPTEILGSVYERFLGKVIRLTAGGNAKVEEKPEVRKAGGVYYTPSYIVEYIVKNTVGKLVEGKTPDEVSKIKIVDPACGSGSFLLGTYQFLLDWHLDYYASNNVDKWVKNKTILTADNKTYRLSIDEKKRILLNNIHGVDLDVQAVEVTKLSLLLKVVEDPGQLKMFEEGHILPNLNKNIKNGNALIGTDYFSGQMFGDMEEMKRVKPFDWKSEFPEVFKRGGFDAVIGNPPYVSVELTVKDITEYYLNTYKTAFGRANTFALFLEKSFSFLKENGLGGYIVSNRLLSNAQLSGLRKFILDNSLIEKILAFKTPVFGAAVDTTVIIFKKSQANHNHMIEILYDIHDLINKDFEVNNVAQLTFQQNASFLFNIRQRETFTEVISKIRNLAIDLDQICEIRDGIILGDIKDLFLSESKIDNRYEKWLEGNEVSRYSIEWTGRYICYDKSLADEEMRRKLEKAKRSAKSSSDFDKINQSGVRLRTPDLFRQEKILTRQNAKRLIGVLDDGNNYFVKNSLHCTLLKDKSYNLRYILAVINSRLLDFYFQNAIGNTGEIFSQMKIAYITKLPIRSINFSIHAEKAKHDKIVSLVEQMLALHKSLAEAKTPQEGELIQRQITSTDKAIDSLVYELYGLSQEEIGIVEGEKK